MKTDLVEQTTKLASNFPIGCKVRVKAEDVPGRVEGYRKGAHIKRPGELALIVHVPGDTWVLYPDEVELQEECENSE